MSGKDTNLEWKRRSDNNGKMPCFIASLSDFTCPDISNVNKTPKITRSHLKTGR